MSHLLIFFLTFSSSMEVFFGGASLVCFLERSESIKYSKAEFTLILSSSVCMECFTWSRLNIQSIHLKTSCIKDHTYRVPKDKSPVLRDYIFQPFDQSVNKGLTVVVLLKSLHCTCFALTRSISFLHNMGTVNSCILIVVSQVWCDVSWSIILAYALQTPTYTWSGFDGKKNLCLSHLVNLLLMMWQHITKGILVGLYTGLYKKLKAQVWPCWVKVYLWNCLTINPPVKWNIIPLSCRFWNLSWDILRLLWQPPSSAWT